MVSGGIVGEIRDDAFQINLETFCSVIGAQKQVIWGESCVKLPFFETKALHHTNTFEEHLKQENSLKTFEIVNV